MLVATLLAKNPVHPWCDPCWTQVLGIVGRRHCAGRDICDNLDLAYGFVGPLDLLDFVMGIHCRIGQIIAACDSLLAYCVLHGRKHRWRH